MTSLSCSTTLTSTIANYIEWIQRHHGFSCLSSKDVALNDNYKKNQFLAYSWIILNKIITRMSLYEQSWLEEEQDSRDQTIHTMTELRRRSRPNADLEDLDEDFIPSPTLPTPREEFVQESSPAYYNPGAENLQGESEDQEAKKEWPLKVRWNPRSRSKSDPFVCLEHTSECF